MTDKAIINALSVDVEDYFQVSAFDRVVSRDTWSTFDSRVAANTHRLLDLFDETGVKGTFFTLGWIAANHPELVRDIAARGHEIASHGYNHQLVYMLTPYQLAFTARILAGAAQRTLVRAASRQLLLERSLGSALRGGGP